MNEPQRTVSGAEVIALLAVSTVIGAPVAMPFAVWAWRWRRDAGRDVRAVAQLLGLCFGALLLAVVVTGRIYAAGWSALAQSILDMPADHGLIVAALFMVPIAAPAGVISGVLGRDLYVWQRKRHPIHGRAIRAREQLLDQQYRARQAAAPDNPMVLDGKTVLGVHLQGQPDRSWQSGQYVMLPDAASHIVAIGATGAGKTQSILRIAQAHLQLGWRVLIIDAKEDYDTAAAWGELAGRVGVPECRNIIWPQAGPMDLFRGSPTGIRDRLMACAGYTEPYYRSVAGTLLTLVTHDDPPVRTFPDVLRRLDHGALKARWAGTPDAHIAGGLKPDDVQGVRYRYFDLARQLDSIGAAGEAPGAWGWEDCDAAWITLPTSTRPEAAAAFGRAMLVDLISYIRDSSRRDSRPILLIVEELGAIVAGDGETARLIVEAFERARSAHVRTIVSVQTPDGLGPPDMQARILHSGAAVLAHRMPAPELICNLLGTSYGLEASLGVTRAGDLLDAGSVREQSQFVLSPNTVRQLPVGQAMFIHGHHWSQIAVPRAVTTRT
jgi:hypothetical protein